MTYTIKLTKEQKDIIYKALDTFSHMHLGQTAAEQEAAAKIYSQLTKTHTQSNIDIVPQDK